MKLRFKIGTAPLSVHEVDFLPDVGDRLDLPFPNSNRAYPVRIYDIYKGSTPEDCIFYGEWL